MVSLHQDVLEAICEFLDNYPDLISFSLTCSALRSKAVQSLLHLRPVNLANEQVVCAFHRFVFANPEARGQHICGIETPLKYPSVSEKPLEESSADVATCFIEILENATHLRHLTLSLSDFYRSYLDDERVVPAVSRLMTLTDLSLLGDSQRGHELLRTIRSPIQTIKIRSINYDPSSPIYIDSMANFAPTLENVELGLGQIHFDNFEARPRFPAVRSLKISIVRGPPRLGALLHIFPSLSGSLLLFHPSPIAFDELAIREDNKRAQESCTQGWKRLDHVSCPPKLLFALNLQCPVARITLDCWDEFDSSYYISSTLRETPPHYLELFNVRLPQAVRTFSEELFPPEAQETITHFLLVMRYESSSHLMGEPCTFQWKDVMDKLRAAIRPLKRLAHLRIITECFIQPVHCAKYAEDFVQILCQGEEAQYRYAAEAFAAAVPSLQNIVFSSNGLVIDAGHWRLGSGWRVVRHEGSGEAEEEDGSVGGCHVEALGSEGMKAILRREDLINSRDESVELWDFIAEEFPS